MSLRYRNNSGEETIIAGLTPGGDIEAGAVAQRSGTTSSVTVASGGATETIAVAFDSDLPDDDYIVTLNAPSTGRFSMRVTDKTASGFNIQCMNNTGSSGSSVIEWAAFKTYTIQHAAQNAESIATLEAMVPSGAGAGNKLVTASQLTNTTSPIANDVTALQDLIPVGASVTNQLVTASQASVDSALSATSEHAVQNKVVKAALDAKQDTLTFDNTPTAGSNNPVTSTGIKSAIDNIIQSNISNPNLLDNPWFTVNQRKFNDASGGGTDSYRFDRWRGTYGYDTTNNIPAFTGVQYAIQRFEPNVKDFLDGKLLTASIMYSDGTIESGTFTYYKQPSNWITVSNINKVYVQIGYNATASNILNGSFCITNRNTDLSIKAVKVELGTISTLINDVPPNYQQELAKCQRYYYELNNNDGWCPIGHGHFRSDSIAEVLFKHPVEMRTSPTITLSNINGVTMSYPFAGGTDILPTSMEVNLSTKREASLLFNTPNVATVNSCTEAWLKPDVPAKLTFSADL